MYNDKLNQKYKEQDYFNDYYKKTSKSYVCERCGKNITSNTNKAKHQATERCKRIYAERQRKEQENELVRKVVVLSLQLILISS